MTTTVTITTVSWPVKLTIIDDFGKAYSQTTEEVPPNTTRQFHLTQTRRFHLKELSTPVQKPQEAA